MNLTNNQTNTNQRVLVLSEYLNPVIIRILLECLHQLEIFIQNLLTIV